MATNRTGQVKWGTILDAELAADLSGAARAQKVTIADFVDRALRSALQPPLLNLFVPTTPIVVGHVKGNPVVSDMSAISLLAEHWGSESLHVLPGSKRLISSPEQPSIELRRDLIVLGGPRRNDVAAWIQATFKPSWRFEQCSCQSEATVSVAVGEQDETPQHAEPRPWHLHMESSGLVHNTRYRKEDDIIPEWYYENWGVVRLQRNPYGIDESSRILLLIGLDREATFGCVRAVTSGRFMRMIYRELSLQPNETCPDFDCLVTVRAVRGVPLPVEPLPGSVQRIS